MLAANVIRAILKMATVLVCPPAIFQIIVAVTALVTIPVAARSVIAVEISSVRSAMRVSPATRGRHAPIAPKVIRTATTMAPV